MSLWLKVRKSNDRPGRPLLDPIPVSKNHALTRGLISLSLVKHSDISALKLGSSTQDEWEDILLSVLRGVPPADDAVMRDVEVVAKVEKKAKSLTITIQRRVEGITASYHQIPQLICFRITY